MGYICYLFYVDSMLNTFSIKTNIETTSRRFKIKIDLPLKKEIKSKHIITIIPTREKKTRYKTRI
jgi:hypothetical protein